MSTVSTGSDSLIQLMSRAEAGLQHADDAEILFEALKSAAEVHTNPEETLTFLKFHLGRGLGSQQAKKQERDRNH